MENGQHLGYAVRHWLAGGTMSSADAAAGSGCSGAVIRLRLWGNPIVHAFSPTMSDCKTLTDRKWAPKAEVECSFAVEVGGEAKPLA